MTRTNEELVLQLLSRGCTLSELHYYLTTGARLKRPGFVDPGTLADLERVLRGMERRGMVTCDGQEWKRREKREARLFA